MFCWEHSYPVGDTLISSTAILSAFSILLTHFPESRHGVLHLLLENGLRAFPQADVQLFLADVDAHLIILHSFALSFC